MKSSPKSRKLKSKVWLLYVMTFALIGGIVTLFISSAQSAVIKNLQVTGTTPTSVSLAWDANPIASQPGGGYKIYRNSEKIAQSPATSYTDTGLTTGTVYKYSVSAYNGQTETPQSPKVSAKPIDNPPTVSISGPADKAMLRGTVSVTATANDDVKVASVQFLVDGTVVLTSTTGPYTYSWNTATATNAKHQLTAVATDSGNQKVTSSKVAVIVDNAKPTVSFTSPSGSSGSSPQVSGNVAIEVKANDDNSVAGVTIQLDGQNLAPEITSKPYKLTWDSTKTSNGPHSLTATARDGVGNLSDTASLTVNVSGGTADVIQPKVNITNPKKDQTISGSVTISATASDNVGVSKVSISLMNLVTKPPTVLLGEDTSTPYELNWDSTKHANGKYRLIVTAHDAAGNDKSDSVDVTINNTGPDTTPPSVNLTSPNNGDKVSGVINLHAQATDNVGVVGVQFKLDTDNNNAGSEIQNQPYKTTLDTGPLTAGDHNIYAVARDAAGNTKTSDKVKVTVKASADKSDPTITNISPADKSFFKGGSLTLKADVTDNVKVAGVQFSIDNKPIGGEITTPTSGNTFQTSWTTTDDGHNLKVEARDSSGNKIGKSVHFNVDNKPPTVSFTAPGNNSTVSGNKVKLSVNAKDNGQVANVEYKLDGNGQICKPTQSPFSCSWDTTTLGNGAHSVTAIATDGAGNSATATVNVTVSNSGVPGDKLPPSVPTGLAATPDKTSVSLSWQASTDNQDGSGVAGYIVYRDGKDIKHVTTPAYVDTGLKQAKTYKYKVSAYDNSGNESKASAEVKTTTTGSSTASLTITSPANGDNVKGDVTATASVANGSAFTNVQFTLDNKNYKTPVTVAPYSVVINTSSLKDGKHSLGAIGTDSTSHKTSAKPVNFQVDNHAPTISISAPNKDQTIKGKFTLKVNVKDTGGDVDHIQYLLDGHELGVQIKSPFHYLWDSRSSSNGSHKLKAVATDKSGNNTTSDEVSFKVQNSDSCVDTQAPTVPGGLAKGEVNPTTVNFSWQASTDTGCSGLAGYAIYRDGTQIATTADTSYTDSGLLPNKAYNYTVAAFDNATNKSAQSSALSITTTTTGDGSPVVVFVAPENGAKVSGVVALIASATDDQGVAKVEFKQNGQLIGAATDQPYSVDWDTTKLATKTGVYTLTATATDTTGHIATATIKLKVDNQVPAVAITAPKDGAKVNGKVNVNITVTDNDSPRVDVLIDSKPVGQAAKQGTNDQNKQHYRFTWQANNYAKGPHTIKAMATDPAGNSVSSTQITVTNEKQTCTDNTAPPVPANFKIVSSTTHSINLKWDKVKDQGCAGISGYAIYRDGDFLTATNNTTYVDNDVVIGTGYRYNIVAIDKAGNLSDKSPDLVGATKQRPGAVAGDVDFDNHVNGRDVSIILSNFKKSHSKHGDANLDGQVDGADVSVVLSNFGKH